ncbi:MAG: YceI family protein [Acidobacteriota bacterium]|nr:YceI family protein [Acidobacteriota bacterium]
MSSSFMNNAFAVLLFFAAPVLTWQAQTSRPEGARSSEPFVLRVDPARSNVHWTVDSSLHTVHGTFHVKRGSVTIDPVTGKASGEIVVDATSGESGNDSRDHKMHKEVLESEKYSEIIFRPDRVDGTIAKQGNSKLALHGMFSLHGAEHEFSAPAKAELSADRWKGSAAITVPYIEWKLKNPSNFLLKVKPIVEVQIELVGSVQGPASH